MDRLLAASGLKAQRPELKPPDCIARYVVVKHSWRGKYKRIVCITPTALYTQNQEARMVVTNRYAFAAVSGDGPVAMV
jgi:DnaJ family protein C protein 13